MFADRLVHDAGLHWPTLIARSPSAWPARQLAHLCRTVCALRGHELVLHRASKSRVTRVPAAAGCEPLPDFRVFMTPVHR